ncbi:MAG: 50S ribosomal protein L11 [Chloroflexi bacterium]|nr:50S ribosomal protein L11 [Chloroflexota bacterium]MCY3583710.1 50S ribosomal protein L11 [Chloroflexota bacterium]MCY3717316.1 50S ribosomal protein L11 [Chloroflexota bacterium]MDE2649772.1 50S ribosomal protein L11 [Chloroflexota bacterium]MXX50827.1 50S ribosomal protein L11 [Chloroflexota bacterium]
MAKKIKAVVKLQIPAGKANPAPPIGPALAQHGINLMQFCKEYNGRTSSRMGDIVPAEITIFSDGSFKFALKSPPTSFLIKRAAGISKAASNPATETVATLMRDQVREIAQAKMNDMNAIDIEGAMRQVEGTARQMGIKVAD